MEYRDFGKTGIKISAVSYGGIVSAGFYDRKDYPEDCQEASDRYVSWAIDKGINYFDVAPTYGNAEAQLGNSLIPYRKNICLACKTAKRSRAEAEPQMLQSLKNLHTDYFDVYQLHEISNMEAVEAAFAPGGVMELMREMKEKGIARHISFTAHNEEAAIEMIRRFDFESVLFPLNWHLNMDDGTGSRLVKLAKERGMGVLAMKSFIERRWDSEAERYASRYPKSWCKPIDVEDEAFGLAAMKYALSMGVDTLVPPGNFASFSFAVEHIGECLRNPLTDADRAFLEKKLEAVRGKRFF